MSVFVPNLCRKKAWEITRADLDRLGVEGLILDVDNTLTRHNHPDVDEKITAWLEEMKGCGVKMAVLSNNSAARVAPFAAKLGLAFEAGAFKPMTGGYHRAAKLLGLSVEKTAVVGDQIFTDIAGGNRAGAKSILVEPFEMERHWGFRLKRWLERPVLRRIQKR
ncbi:MAG: YqeG family HAD IIIA-type phosphatase [Oscillospiraceae bacterium]|nr:YqeG family HAD IIIA-type phosphatase [Oscillospiraceae bacterium]